MHLKFFSRLPSRARCLSCHCQANGNILDQDLGGPVALMRHVLTTTTVNLISSSQLSVQQGPEFKDVQLPASFFVNIMPLQSLLRSLGAAFPDTAVCVPGLVFPHACWGRAHFAGRLFCLHARCRQAVGAVVLCSCFAQKRSITAAASSFQGTC